MGLKTDEVEALLPGYFSGDITEDNRKMIDEWRKLSTRNEDLFLDTQLAWAALPALNEMEKFNSFKALERVNAKIIKSKYHVWWRTIQRIAAVIILPLMIYSAYQAYHNHLLTSRLTSEIVETVVSRQGMVSMFSLEDGTKIWLNSNSEIKFPTHFSGEIREVWLKGEAFFDVARDENHPFSVKTKDLSINALGTSFNVMSYEDEKFSEVVLVDGKVRLSSIKGNSREDIGIIMPGEKIMFNNETRMHFITVENTEKHIAWKDGNLIFEDDPMEDVVKKLNRWFNAEIIIDDEEIKDYVYKATFRNENLRQVLDLLKLSAPIDYRISENKVLPDGEFVKQVIHIMKKE